MRPCDFRGSEFSYYESIIHKYILPVGCRHKLSWLKRLSTRPSLSISLHVFSFALRVLIPEPAATAAVASVPAAGLLERICMSCLPRMAQAKQTAVRLAKVRVYEEV